MECTYCGKRLANSYNLKQHNKIYHVNQGATNIRDKTIKENNDLMTTFKKIEKLHVQLKEQISHL